MATASLQLLMNNSIHTVTILITIFQKKYCDSVEFNVLFRTFYVQNGDCCSTTSNE